MSLTGHQRLGDHVTLVMTEVCVLPQFVDEIVVRLKMYPPEDPMSRSRILSSLAAASLGIALLGACSAESLTERAASYGLERAVEGDQDIDLDFSGDGSGGFSVSTEEGDFALNFDEENGCIVFSTDEGDGVISFDEENGSINFDTDQGDGAINFDDDGGVTIQTDEGELGIFTSQDTQPTWLQALGVPATLVPGSQNFSVLDLGDTVVTSGVFNHDPNEPYAATLIATLLRSGWTQNIASDQDGTVFAQLTSPDGSVAQVIGDNSGYTTISLTLPQ
ncbi:MAG: hypothetical protein P8P20_10380 [Acidimicrobiales bacterium]|nr:hypothetical protein [Acidimicrobiales bacterium]